MYKVESEFSFDSAHFLKDHPGKCRYIHGHRWRVLVELKSRNLEDGMVVDFSDLKQTLKVLEEEFDHTLIIENGSVSLDLSVAMLGEGFRMKEVEFRPTAENMASYFYYRIMKSLFGTPIKMSKVTVYETPNNKASYEED